MIELNDIEIEAVAGGSMITLAVTIANYGLEFFTGFYDGLRDASS